MTISSEFVLLDTNVLVHAYNADAPEHAACRAVIERGHIDARSVCTCPQVLLEFLTVITNPKRVKDARTVVQACRLVEELAAALPLIQPPADLHERVVASYRGKEPFGRTQAFDLAIAATMSASGITHVCTYDEVFSRIPGITVLTP